jgi:hypothetical protein
MQKTQTPLKIRDVRYARLVPEIVLRFENAPGIYRVPLRSV